MTKARGMWVTPTQYVSFAESGIESLSNEIAVRSRSIDFYSVGNFFLPNPDPILKAQGKDITVYNDLLVDDRVSGGMINRTAASKSMVWEIDRGRATARQHKAVQTVFGKLQMNRIIEHILKARAFGYAPIEVIWNLWEGLTVPVDLKLKPQRWFVFDYDNNLAFWSKDNIISGEALPARKFICPANEADYANPYGLGLLSRCFWPVIFKRGGWKFWTKFAEKYGAVWPVGKLPRTATPAQRNEFMGVLDQMIQDGVAVIPDDGSVEFLESGDKGGTSSLFNDLITSANSAISTVWLGHAGAGESTPGKLGSEKAAVDVRDDLKEDDANLIMQTLQTVIDWMFEVNWGGSDDACRFVLREKDKIDTSQAERDDKLTSSLDRSGLKLSSIYYQKTYKLDPEDIEQKQQPTEKPDPAKGKTSGPEFSSCPHCSSFAEHAAPDAVDALVDQALTVADGSDLVAAIYDAIAGADTLPAAARGLKSLQLRRELQPSFQALYKACLIGNLTGRAEVVDETTGERYAEPGAPLPFDEAIAFFRQKLNVTSERWTSIWKGEHSRQFTVAGAMVDEMVEDFRAAIDQAIAEGNTHAAFVKEFDAIVERYGWSYKGSRGWRSRVIFETNVRTSYAAGRWQQLTDPDLLQVNPYLEYRHGDSVKPRPLHVSWDGTVLPATDAWWNTHYVPNGWGCKCKVFSAGNRDLQKMGKNGPDKAPDDGTYEWVDKKTGEVHDVPRGIDPGWDYNPGKEWLNPTTGKRESL